MKPVRSNWMFSLQWFLATAGGLVIGFGLMFVGIGAVINNAAPFCFRLGARSCVGTCIRYNSVAGAPKLYHSFSSGGFYLHVWHGEFFGPLNIAGVFGQGSGVIGKVWEGVGHGILFGFLLGLSQWLVLRNKVYDAETWIWVNIIGWGMGAALGDEIKVALNVDGPIEVIIGFVIATILGGVYLARMINKTN